MTSAEIKAAFTAAGIKVRVKALNRGGFRICTLDGAPHGQASQDAAAALGLTAAWGEPGGFINNPHEMFCYAPGVVRVVKK